MQVHGGITIQTKVHVNAIVHEPDQKEALIPVMFFLKDHTLKCSKSPTRLL